MTTLEPSAIGPHPVLKSRWAAARRIGGYGAALALTPYFVIKVFWTIDGLSGGGLHSGTWSALNWAAINAMTVGMAGLGILLGLALGSQWGLRVPAWLFAVPAWVGMGFLVSLIPAMPALFVASDATSSGDAFSAFPGWELPLIEASFAGMGLGLAVGFPSYARQRWPEAFVGRVNTDTATSVTTGLSRVLSRIAAVLCAVLSLPQLFWAFGGTVGLNPANLANRDLRWHVLTGTSGLWALIAAWGVWTMAGRRSRARFWIPMLLTWIASGSLFAWGCWKGVFMFTANLNQSPLPEYPIVVAVENQFGAIAGLLVLTTTLLILAARKESVTGSAG